jgi:outer membrane receptor for ferrienterochelin and colicins
MLRIKHLFLLLLFPVTAISQEDSSERVLSIEEVVVTGQFEPTSLKNSVYKVRSINREYIQRRGTTDMSTLLNMELGVRFSNDLVLGESDMQLMGMSGQNVKVLINGVPMIDRGATKQSLSQIDLNTIERIEIVEGPVSVMYGTDALAGVINIITSNPNHKTSKLGITARILEETVGSEYKPVNDEGRHNAHLGLKYSTGIWRFELNGSRNNFGGFQGTSEGRKLQWQPKEQWLGSGKIGFEKENFNTSYSIDYLNEDLYTPGAVMPNSKYVDKNYFTYRITQILQSQYTVNDHFVVNGSFSYQNYKRSTVTELFDLSTQTSSLTSGAGEQDITRFNQAFARVNGLYKISNNIDLLAGLELDFDKGSGARIQENSEIYDFAGFLTADYKPLSWLMIRPGVRFIHNSIYNAPPAIPSLNMRINFNPLLNLRLGYAMGFRAPSLRELYFTFHDSNHAINGNTDLKAEHNQNFNASLSYHKNIAENSTINSSLSGFYNHFNNLITIGQDKENISMNTYLNIGKFETMGGSLENNLLIKNSKISVGVSYIGRLNSLFEENKDLGQYFWTPEVNGSISHEFPKWKANVNVFYKLYGQRPGFQTTGSGDQLEIHQAKQEAYHQMDISLNKRLYNSITVQAGVRNLTNITNVLNTATEGTGAHSSSSTSIPISYGRSVFFGLLYQINK